MVPIPDYLKDIAVHESSKGMWTTFSLKCPCGCTFFRYFQNYLTKEDVIVPERPYFSSILRITVQCAECGKKHVLFDSRFHGYDGVTGECTAQELAYESHMKQRRGGPIAIQVKVENDETPESFRECSLPDTADYSDPFSWIIVYKIADGKKTKIFELETA